MNKIRIILVVLVSVILFTNCDESSSSNVEPEENANYMEEIQKLFTASSGNSFKYAVDTLNLKTGQYEYIGNREVIIGNKIEDGEYGYYSCSEIHNYNSKTAHANSKFRITNTTLDFYADQSGVPNLIPDSVVVEIVLDLDEVYKIVEFPYESKEWGTYKGSAGYGTFKFNIFNISGQYVGDELLSLDGFDSGISTKKFKYNIVLDIPNLSNPFASNAKYYEAFVWISPEIGVVKLEGCSLFINPISGGQFNDADSNKVQRHTLVSSNR